METITATKFAPGQVVKFHEERVTVRGVLPVEGCGERHYIVEFSRAKGNGPSLRVEPELHHICEHNLVAIED